MASGNVYIADMDNNAIKEWVAASNTVTTLVSSGLICPYGVAVDGAGNVYIADSDDNAIKEWMAASNTVTTLVSSGLAKPAGVAVDGSGNVYIRRHRKQCDQGMGGGQQLRHHVLGIFGITSPWRGGGWRRQCILHRSTTYNNTIVGELPRAFVDTAAKLEPAAAGSDVLPGCCPPQPT